MAGKSTRTPEARFWEKVQSATHDECWIWNGAKDKGYGRFNLDGRTVASHRLAYQWLVGEIPEGLQLDHLCRTPACVNPWHLDPVTPLVNTLRSEAVSAIHSRKTHCSNGHPFAGDNLLTVRGKRRCRACHNRRSNDSHHRRKGAA